MQNQRDEKNRLLIMVGVTLIAALLGLAGGLGIGAVVLDTDDKNLESLLRDSQAQLSQAQDETQSLQTTLEEQQNTNREATDALDEASQREESLKTQLAQAMTETSSALEELAQSESAQEVLLASNQERLSSAQEQAATLEEQVQNIQSDLSRERSRLQAFDDMANNVELHRLLLVELRRDLPQTRDEAFDYWSNVRTLAAKAEPALAPPADGVILKIDNYFDWSDRTPNPNAPTDEYLDAYFDWQVDYTTSGAGAYVDAVETFTNYALEAVITQLDSVVLRLE